MKNIFQKSSSNWVRYDKYEWRTAADGKCYITPAADAKPSIYNPIKDYETLVLTAINIGTTAMNKASESELKEAIMDFVSEYGMLGLMTALPTTPDFITYEAVYLPKNHFIREENISTEKYLSYFFPFDKIDFRKKGIESSWSTDSPEMIALIMTMKNKPQAVVMSFQREYAESYDWLVEVFRDWAFTFFSSFLYYQDYDRLDENERNLYRQGMAAFGGVAPTYHIELREHPTLVWDFNSLLLCVQMMFSFMLTDDNSSLKVCKHCGKAFVATRPNMEFCSPQCKNQYNVYKSRAKKNNDSNLNKEEDIHMNKSNIIMYTTEDGLTKIETTFDEDTVWLSIDQMAELFQRNKSTISRHISKIYEEGELSLMGTVAKFATVQMEGTRSVERNIEYYNLDVIISVGYRVKSHRGTQFRIWAMGILKEYMKKGFALDDDRLKRLGGGNYFDELLARIRDIRSSEKVFWRKVLEIYATSIDYDPHAESSVLFFKQMQNKMHWAAHKHTAAEVIYERADAEKENMGLTSWEHDEIRRSDVEVAKNYLTEQELDALNKIVTAYLDIAEVHALNKEPMYMKDWLETIDDYLKMTRRDILTSSGHISHKQAIEKAHAEYDKYKNRLDDTLSPVEKDFIESIGMLEEIVDNTL